MPNSVRKVAYTDLFSSKQQSVGEARKSIMKD